MELRYAELSPQGERVEPVYNRETRRWEIVPNEDGLQIVELPYQGDTPKIFYSNVPAELSQTAMLPPLSPATSVPPFPNLTTFTLSD